MRQYLRVEEIFGLTRPNASKIYNPTKWGNSLLLTY